MKLLCVLVIVAAIVAMCSAASISLGDAEVQHPRERRQAVLVNGFCPKGKSRLRGRCISCDDFEEATGRRCPGNIKPRKYGFGYH